MLPVYLGALAFGGTLLVASLVLGFGHHDAGGGGHDHDKGHDKGSDGFGWLPVASVRFWTFFLGFGGLAGTLLTYATGTAWPIVAGASAVVGWASGVGVVGAMRRVKDGPGSELSTKELRGETAEVLVPVKKGSFGKVRVEAKGRVFDLIAETEEDETFAAGAKVMIVGEGDEGRVQIAAQA
jgi:membrane protein implicated in regulation of membrane protease activity